MHACKFLFLTTHPPTHVCTHTQTHIPQSIQEMSTYKYYKVKAITILAKIKNKHIKKQPICTQRYWVVFRMIMPVTAPVVVPHTAQQCNKECQSKGMYSSEQWLWVQGSITACSQSANTHMTGKQNKCFLVTSETERGPQHLCRISKQGSYPHFKADTHTVHATTKA